MKLPALIAAVGCLTLAESLMAQGIGSLSDLDIEFTEARLTLETATEEIRVLKERIAVLKETIKSLSESLAQASNEAELFRRENTDIKLRMEALGLESVGSEKGKLEQRLLKSVRDLQIVNNEKQKLSEQLMQMSEAALRFIKDPNSSNGETRAELEVQLRASAAVLGYAPNLQEAKATRATLSDSLVISLKEDIGLVVINVGTKDGVKLGMPFKIWRDENPIGKVIVVEAREEISGAVIQDLSSTKTKIKVGDRVKVDAR